MWRAPDKRISSAEEDRSGPARKAGARRQARRVGHSRVEARSHGSGHCPARNRDQTRIQVRYAHRSLDRFRHSLLALGLGPGSALLSRARVVVLGMGLVLAMGLVLG